MRISRKKVAIINTSKLKGKIVENNTTIESVATSLGLNRSTIYRRMKAGGESFTIGEMYKIIDYLSLSQQDAIDIFLSQYSHLCE